MGISLSPELENLIHQKLATGRFSSVDDVLAAALRALDSEDETIAAITEGYEDFLAGRVCTLEEANAEFNRKHGLPLEE